MTVWRPFVVTEEVSLPGADPARVWAMVADLDRLEEWTPLEDVDWAGDLPGEDQEFTGRARLGPLSRRLTFRIEEWEAGRWFRIGVLGIPLVRQADLRVGMETERPDAPRVVLREGGSAPGPLLAVFRLVARRWARRALQRLGDAGDWPLPGEEER